MDQVEQAFRTAFKGHLSPEKRADYKRRIRNRERQIENLEQKLSDLYQDLRGLKHSLKLDEGTN